MSTAAKIQKLFACCNLLLQKTTPTLRQVAEVIGVLVSPFPGVEYGPLHYWHLDGGKYTALVAKKDDFSSTMRLSPSALTELQWLLEIPRDRCR